MPSPRDSAVLGDVAEPSQDLSAMAAVVDIAGDATAR